MTLRRLLAHRLARFIEVPFTPQRPTPHDLADARQCPAVHPLADDVGICF